MRKIQERLLTDRITVRKPVQSMVPSTRRPVFQFQVFETGVKARFNPNSTNMNREVLGKAPKKSFRLFLNSVDLKENDEIINEATGDVFVVTEVRDYFGHHLEAVLEEKQK
jgi:hypothetical protein